jgi:hypothetical protein
VVSGLLLGLLAGVAVLLLGWPVDVVDEPATDTSADSASVATGYQASPYYDEVIEQYGYPHTWWVTDGTNSPGQQPVRAEQWFYPEQGLWIWFIDGWRGPEEYFTPEEAIFDSYTDVTPTDLNRTMTLDDLDIVIGAERQWLGPVTADTGDLDTWVYPEAGLVVQLLDGRFFSAQTI